MSEGLFQKSLQDLVKGIRSHKRDASAFISQCVVDIKTELRSTDISIKAEAVRTAAYPCYCLVLVLMCSLIARSVQVRKLTYLQMIGYNESWASFGIVEVMSQPRFSYKRIGCMAANQVMLEGYAHERKCNGCVLTSLASRSMTTRT
jgi:AP-3 complex subunit delta-1